MRRYNRAQFVAFGLLNLLNAAGLLLYGLGLSTHGSDGAERSVPALIAIAGLIFLGAFVAAIKRGHDIGWSGWLTGIGFWFSVSLGPALLILAGYFAMKGGEPEANAYGAPPRPGGIVIWLQAIPILICPWLALAMIGLAL